MADRPSDDEIARVDAWKRAQGEAKAAESRRKQNEIEANARDEIAGRLVGRTIKAVQGQQDYSDWLSVILTFEDGGTVLFSANAWSDRAEIDVEFNEPSE